MRRALFFLGCLAACADVASAPATTPRESLSAALTRAAGCPVRVTHEEDGVAAYVEGDALAATDRPGGARRAQALIDATRDGLGLDPKQIGAIEWGEHPKPVACAPQLWPGTTEPTTHGICIAFDHEHRPRWMRIGWAPSIAEHHEAIKPSRDVLAELARQSPPGVSWDSWARLELDADRPVYYVGSDDADGMSTTTVDAVTGAVLGVRRIRYDALEEHMADGGLPAGHPPIQ